MRTCPVCNTKRQQKPAQGALKKKENSPAKKVSFVTTVKKQAKKEKTIKHARGFVMVTWVHAIPVIIWR